MLRRLTSYPAARLAALLGANLVVLALFATFFWFDNEHNRGVTLVPPTQPFPFTDGAQAGVNLYNLQAEADPAAITRSFAMVRAMGARYARMQVPWEDIEIHGRGDFMDRRNVATVGVISAWDKYDHIVDAAQQAGVNLIMRLDRPPDWARAETRSTPFFQAGLKIDGQSTGPPDQFEDYGNFVYAVVSRYRGKVRFYQLWNEPNLKNEWNWQTPKPEDFVRLLKIGYDAAKRADPGAQILFPALSPVDGLDQRAPQTELDYLDQIYQAGGAQYFDIMSAQAYGLGQPPDENRYVRIRPFGAWQWWQRPIDTRADVSRIVLVHEIMERYGDARKPVWISEFGWNSAPASIPPERRTTWGMPVSEEQKGEYLVGMLARARRDWPWVGVMNIWMLRSGGEQAPNPDDPTPYFALVQPDWTPLPAYDLLREYLAQPQVFGVGGYYWGIAEQSGTRWRLRFQGDALEVIGPPGLAATALIDQKPITPTREIFDTTVSLHFNAPSGRSLTHTLDIAFAGPAMPERVLISRSNGWGWLWWVLPLLLWVAQFSVLIPTVCELFRLGDELVARRERILTFLRTEPGTLLLMALAIWIGYRASVQVPLTLFGFGLFALLAFRRPDLALLTVPLTVPLYFMPKAIWDSSLGVRAEGLEFPLHELLLVISIGAFVTHLGWRFWQARQLESQTTRRPDDQKARQPESQMTKSDIQTLWSSGLLAFRRSGFSALWLSGLLFLIAGTLGIIVAGAEGRGAALREWRWTIVEPLLFIAGVFALLRTLPQADAQRFRLRLLGAFVLGGAFAGLVGILQFVGLDLAGLFGEKAGFSDNTVAVEGARRVSSVYGHPNNLGLAMGRVWPLAAALALLFAERGWRRRAWLFGVCAVLALGGLLASFSKGAWLGAGLAGLMLLVLLANKLQREDSGEREDLFVPAAQSFVIFMAQKIQRNVRLIAGLLALVGVLAMFTIPRLNPLGETSGIRIKTWQAALAMGRDHPLFGVGLDQFLRYYPDYIDPALAQTNERFTSHPHDLLLDLWLRTGLLGLFAMLGLIVWLVRSLLHLSRAGERERALLAAGLFAAVVAALAHGLVDQFYFLPDLALWWWGVLAVVLLMLSDPPVSRRSTGRLQGSVTVPLED